MLASGDGRREGARRRDVAEGDVGAPDESVERSGSTDGEPAHELPTASMYVAEPRISATLDEGSAFLAELVRAWQTTAGLERIRIDEDTERRRQAASASSPART